MLCRGHERRDGSLVAGRLLARAIFNDEPQYVQSIAFRRGRIVVVPHARPVTPYARALLRAYDCSFDLWRRAVQLPSHEVLSSVMPLNGLDIREKCDRSVAAFRSRLQAVSHRGYVNLAKLRNILGMQRARRR